MLSKNLLLLLLSLISDLVLHLVVFLFDVILVASLLLQINLITLFFNFLYHAENLLLVRSSLSFLRLRFLKSILYHDFLCGLSPGDYLPSRVILDMSEVRQHIEHRLSFVNDHL